MAGDALAIDDIVVAKRPLEGTTTLSSHDEGPTILHTHTAQVEQYAPLPSHQLPEYSSESSQPLVQDANFWRSARRRSIESLRAHVRNRSSSVAFARYSNLKMSTSLRSIAKNAEHRQKSAEERKLTFCSLSAIPDSLAYTS